MSNADRQKQYRDRKRNANVTRVTVTDERNAPETVTVTPHVGGAGCAAEGELHEVGSAAELMEELEAPLAKPTFADLPLDVRQEIDDMCAESNNGERAGSHSRAAMTERALHYQAMFGIMLDNLMLARYDPSCCEVTT